MSYAEDMGFDGYDAEDFSYSSDSKKYEWEDKTHETHLIHGLQESHLKYIIRGLESGKDYYGQQYKLAYLRKELSMRESINS